MAKQNPNAPELAVNRRQLLTTAAAIAVPTIVTRKPPEVDQAVDTAPVPVAPALNICAKTARRIEEIVARNQIRQEARLPHLTIPKELRRMKTADDIAEFEKFAAMHREAVWDEVLAPVRKVKGNPHWRPKGVMEGLGYQARIVTILRERFEVARTG